MATVGQHSGLGVHRLASALRRGTTAVPQGADVWLDTNGDLTIVNNATVSGNLAVTGTLTVTGAETFSGLVTVTSASGGGAAGALGPQELLVQMTEPATAGATIRNPGYIDFEGRYWETTGPSSTTQRVGSLGMVVDTITAATGVPLTYRHVLTDRAGTLRWSLNQAGLMACANATLSGITANAFLYSGAAGALATTAAPTNGQLLIGSTGAVPVAASLTAPAAGITITGGAGTIVFALADDLSAIEALDATAGYLVKTGANAYARRTLTGTANQIAITNGDGSVGNPVLSTPQDIATSSSPTFANIALGAGGDITSIDEIAFADAAAGASATGRLRRNATNLEYHDGTASRVIYRASGTDVAVADGGTGLSSFTVGDVLYASAATTIAGLADVATGQVLVSGGVGVAPSWSASPSLTSLTTTGAITASGLLTANRATGSGATGALGPQLALLDTTEAATAGATIRNPGYIDFRGRYWETTGPSSSTQRIGSYGMVVDTITAATGVPLTYRHVWTDTAGAYLATLNAAGRMVASYFQGSSAVQGPAGSAAVASFGYSATDNDGLFFPAAGILALTTAGVERVRWSASGQAANVTGTAAAPGVFHSTYTTTGLFWAAGPKFGFSAAGGEVMAIDDSAGTKRWSLFGVTPSARATAYTQTYATADKTHANFTSADLGAFTGGVVGFLDAAERDNVRTQFNALRADVADLKQLANSIIDDLQAYGAFQ